MGFLVRFYKGEIGASVLDWELNQPDENKAAWRRKAPSGSATKLDGDTILVGWGSNPRTPNNLLDRLTRTWENYKNMTNKPTFRDFIQAVDNDCNIRLGMSIHDLADFPFMDYWDDDIIDLKEFDNAVSMCVEDLLAECEMEELHFTQTL